MMRLNDAALRTYRGAWDDAYYKAIDEGYSIREAQRKADAAALDWEQARNDAREGDR